MEYILAKVMYKQEGNFLPWDHEDNRYRFSFQEKASTLVKALKEAGVELRKVKDETSGS